MEIEGFNNSLQINSLVHQYENKRLFIQLGVIGKMCSGKTTLCNYIHKYLHEKYEIELKSLTFAGKVYELAYDLFDMDRTKKDRKLLQRIGSYMREIDENVWINYVMKKARDSHVIVEDCRYRNEFESLVNNKFLMIKINIDDEYQLERLQRTYPDTYEKHVQNLKHPSEMDIENLEENKCSLVLNARDNELNFEKVKDFLDNYIETNKQNLHVFSFQHFMVKNAGQFEYT